MTITGGSALPKDDIERMMRDAQDHADEDKRRREEAETRNLAEQLQWQTEKFLAESGDKLPAEPATRSTRRSATCAARSAAPTSRRSSRRTRSSRRSPRRPARCSTPAGEQADAAGGAGGPGDAGAAGGPDAAGEARVLRAPARRAATTWSTPRSSRTTRSDLLSPLERGSRMTDQARAADESAPGWHRAARPRRRERGRIVVRDKRRIDPTGDGQEREAASSPRTWPTAPTTVAAAQAAAAGDASAAADAAEAGGKVADGASGDDGDGAGGDRRGRDHRRRTRADQGHQAGWRPRPTRRLEALRSELEERTRDLSGSTAEYANYRKRVDRDRALVAEQTTGAVLAALLPVLDDLDRARDHGDLVGPFGAVAEQLIAALAQVRADRLRREGRPVRPDPPRGGRPPDLGRRDRADVHRRDAPRLPARRATAATGLVAVADPESSERPSHGRRRT